MENKAFRVLLVADEPECYHQIGNLLSQIELFRFQLDWVVSKTGVLEAILHWCSRTNPTEEYHIYLIDSQLNDSSRDTFSDRNELDWLPTLVEQVSPAPVILLVDTPDSGKKVLEAGAADYLEKLQLTVSLLERSLRLTLAHAHTQAQLRKRDAGGCEPLGLRGVTPSNEVQRTLQQAVRKSRQSEVKPITHPLNPEASDREQQTYPVTENIREVFFINSMAAVSHSMYISPADEDAWSHSDESLYQQSSSWLEVVHPADRDRIVEALNRQAQGEPFREEYRIVGPDGSVRWIFSRAFAIRNEAGEILRYVDIAEDITERKRAEEELVEKRTAELIEANHQLQREITERQRVIEERTKDLKETIQRLQEQIRKNQQAEEDLRASEERFRAIFHHSAEGIFLVDVLPNGQFVYNAINPTYQKAMGKVAEQMVGRTVSEVMPREIADQIEKRYRSCITAKKPITYEETWELTQGKRMWRTILVPIPDTTGRIIKLQGSCRDITEEKLVIAQQLRQTRYRHLLTSIPLKIRASLQIQEILQTTVTQLQKILSCDRVLFFRWSSDGSGTVVNEAVLPEFPAMQSEVIVDECCRERCLEKYHQGYVYALADTTAKALHPCYLEFLQRYQIRANLIVPIWVSHLSLEPGEKEPEIPEKEQMPHLWGLLCVQQCSEPREWTTLEMELMQQLANQLSIALYQAQLLECETRQRQALTRSNAELEQFAYVASHDLQEPLQTIANYAQLLERRYKEQLDAKANKFIHYIVDGSLRMQTLINDLLEYSRVGRSQKPFELTDCNWVCQRASANLRQTIRKNQAVVIPSELPQVMADGSQLVQLFQNLIGNAIKYRRQEPPVIHLSAKRQNDAWLFEMSDNGIGIDPNHQVRIFQIFQRLHTQDEYSGTGIGLAICQKIVERHGGDIWVDSEPGQGSTFYFTLPDQNHSTP